MSVLAATVLAVSSGLTMLSPNLIPQPVSLKTSPGEFRLSAGASLQASGPFESVAECLRDRLRPSTGFAWPIRKSGGAIRFVRDAKLKKLGEEGYRLKVDERGAEIRAFGPAGAFYGVQTLLQLLPPDVLRQGKVVRDWSLPFVEIEDMPRFGWRGSMLDPARHFVPKESVLKYLDLMAFHKLNRLHLHLTDDQGWRIEIKRYPKLTSVGAYRKDTMLTYSPPTYSGKPHGGFYTQEDIKEIVAYAAERHITVVPEIEMPGHAQAAIAAYPELGNKAEKLDVATFWGVNENVFNVEDSTIQFLQNVLAEVVELFPGPFIHIGGDECPKVQWKQSERAQAKMKSLGLKNEEELQSWFIRQMDKFLDSKGKRLIGWSEILEGGLAEGAALMVWLGDEGAMEAVSSGHDVVMAQTSYTYLDYYQSKSKKEPHAIGGYLPIEKVYAYNPILPMMAKEHEKHVLGVQYQLWAEYFPDFKHVEYMAFPRACAVAEIAWSPQESRKYEDFAARLPSHLDRLRVLDVNFRALDPGK